jgi:hypothetical protein
MRGKILLLVILMGCGRKVPIMEGLIKERKGEVNVFKAEGIKYEKVEEFNFIKKRDYIYVGKEKGFLIHGIIIFKFDTLVKIDSLWIMADKGGKIWLTNTTEEKVELDSILWTNRPKTERIKEVEVKPESLGITKISVREWGEDSIFYFGLEKDSGIVVIHSGIGKIPYVTIQGDSIVEYPEITTYIDTSLYIPEENEFIIEGGEYLRGSKVFLEMIILDSISPKGDSFWTPPIIEITDSLKKVYKLDQLKINQAKFRGKIIDSLRYGEKMEIKLKYEENIIPLSIKEGEICGGIEEIVKEWIKKCGKLWVELQPGEELFRIKIDKKRVKVFCRYTLPPKKR